MQQADAPSEQAEIIDARAIGEGRESQADIRARQINPVAVNFHAEHLGDFHTKASAHLYRL